MVYVFGGSQGSSKYLNCIERLNIQEVINNPRLHKSTETDPLKILFRFHMKKKKKRISYTVQKRLGFASKTMPGSPMSMTVLEDTIKWEKIAISEHLLPPRTHPLITNISDTEIVILGGLSFGGRLGDGHIFDTTTNTIKKVLNGTYRFVTYGNQCASIGMNKIAALVSNQHSVLELITFTLDPNFYLQNDRNPIDMPLS